MTATRVQMWLFLKKVGKEWHVIIKDVVLGKYFELSS